jgi:mRNA-degrading endonuclease YafQ of YafQ-DinJ toxin-antitoxin module
MKSPFSDVQRIDAFNRDMKKLLKRFKTLEEDLQTLIDVSINAFHNLAIDNGGIVRIPGLGFDEPAVHKVRKFACKSRKGYGVQSGMRLIYAYSKSNDTITLIEIYFKGDKANEDRDRITRLF